MVKRLLEGFRGARRIEWFAALALAALLALMLLNHGGNGGGAGTELELRVERILGRVEGVGKVSAMIAQGEDGEVTGAVIVAQGLTDIRTYLCLQRAVSALLELSPDRIEIIGSGFGSGGGT